MGTINLPNFRTTADVTMNTKLKDGGVYIDWAGLTDIRAWIYSDAQKALAGRVDVTIDQEDSTKAVLVYAGTKAQYPGINRLIIQARYNGSLKTYDRPVFNFVPRTAEATGNVTIDEPETDVEIVVQDISSSILDATILAALSAADRANDAAEAAEHMVDIHQGPPGPAGKAPYIDETTGNWFVWDDQTEQYVDSGKHAQGATGNGIASWSVVESQEDGGSNVVTVTFTDGNSETFTYKNGHTGATPNLTIGTVETGAAGSQAEATITGTAANPVLNLRIPQGVPGVVQAKYVQVDTLPTASASTMNALYLVPSQVQLGTYDIYYTSQDGRETYSWVFLCGTTIQLSDYATKAEVAQLEAELKPTKAPLFSGYLSSNNIYTAGGTSYFFPVPAGGSFKITAGANVFAVIYAFVKSVPAQTGGSADYATGASRKTLWTNGSASGTIPSDAAYLYVSNIISGNSWFPESILIDGYDYAKGVVKQLGSINGRVSDLDGQVSALSNTLDKKTTELFDEIAPISAWDYDNFFLLSDNTFSKSATTKNVFIPLKGGEQIQVDAEQGSAFIVATLKSLPTENGDSADYATGGSRNGGTNLSFIAPSDAKYLYVSVEYNGTNWCPAAIRVNGYDYIQGVKGEIVTAINSEGLTTNPKVNSVLREMVVLRPSFNPDAIKFVIIRKNFLNTNGKYYYGIYFYDNNPGNVIGQVQEMFDVSTEIGDYVMVSNDVALFLSFGDFADGEYRYNVTIREQNIGLHSSPLLREYYYGDSLKKLNPTITDHYFINASNGSIAGNGTTTAGKYTLQFFVPAGATLYVYANGSSTMAIISACDSAGNNIVPLVAGEGVTKEYKYTFDRDSYARASGSNLANVPFVILLASNSNFTGLKKEVTQIRIITDPQRLTDNDTVNTIVRSLYIPSSVVSPATLATVTQFRIYNGYSGYYGVALYDSSNNIIKYVRTIAESTPTDIIGEDGCYTDVDFSKVAETWVHFYPITLNASRINSLSAQPGLYATLNSKRIAILAQDETYFKELGVSPIMNYGERPVLYSGDTKAATNHIVNAVMYPNGVIIAARIGSVVRINLDGTEETLLTIAGASDWRGLFLDKDNNVYASPHASFGSPGGFQMTSRGLYRLAYGQSSFVKVISLYDPNSQNPTEAEQNDDTIWTMCQDRDGYLYAGVYCHTQRYAPRIYRSTDGGITWVDYFDFTTILPNGHHIHSIIFNDYNNALYCIVGEVNTVLKSTDHGTTWANLNVVCEGDKGSSMLAVKDGVIIGSDGAYDCQLSKLYTDDKTVKTVGSFWANTIFAIRKSDVTGWLYAFTKIDSSVNVTSYMPPIAALTDESALATWIASAPSQLANWQRYHNRVKDYYPDDAIRPQHCGILISKDNGETWEALYYKFVTSTGPSGFVTTGYFRNGECLSGLFEDTGDGMAVVNPIIISEGKHKYGANGLTLDGEILIRTNTSDNVTPL